MYRPASLFGASRLARSFGGIAVLSSLAFTAPAAMGQESNTVLVEGATVRITSLGLGLEPDREVGIVREIGETVLLVEFDEAQGVVRIPSNRILTLEVLAGNKSMGWLGAVVGGIAGGAIGWRVGYTKGDDSQCEGLSPQGWLPSFCVKGPTADDKARRHALGYGFVGGAIGWGIAQLWRVDAWETVDVNGTGLTVQPILGPKSRGLALSISF